MIGNKNKIIFKWKDPYDDLAREYRAILVDEKFVVIEGKDEDYMGTTCWRTVYKLNLFPAAPRVATEEYVDAFIGLLLMISKDCTNE